MDGEGVFIPNKELINEPITNLTELGARRTTFEVGVRYGTDVDLAGPCSRGGRRVLRYDLPGSAARGAASARWATTRSSSCCASGTIPAFSRRNGRRTPSAARSPTRSPKHGLVIAFPQRTLWWGDGAKPGDSDG